MRSKRIPRTAGWISALAATLSLGMYVHANSYSTEEDLREYMKQYALASRVLPLGVQTAEIAIDAIVTPEYVVFGDPFGRGTVYTRATTFNNQVVYWAVDYHFTFEDGRWLLSDSTGYVHDPDLVVRARQALQRERFAFLKVEEEPIF